MINYNKNTFSLLFAITMSDFIGSNSNILCVLWLYFSTVVSPIPTQNQKIPSHFHLMWNCVKENLHIEWMLSSLCLITYDQFPYNRIVSSIVQWDGYTQSQPCSVQVNWIVVEGDISSSAHWRYTDNDVCVQMRRSSELALS